MKKLRSEVAVVFQDPASNLKPRQTVESSIMRPMIIHGVPKEEARQKAKEVLEMVKMDQRYLDSYPHQLSGGQLQRIAIARRAYQRPRRIGTGPDTQPASGPSGAAEPDISGNHSRSERH